MSVLERSAAHVLGGRGARVEGVRAPLRSGFFGWSIVAQHPEVAFGLTDSGSDASKVPSAYDVTPAAVIPAGAVDIDRFVASLRGKPDGLWLRRCNATERCQQAQPRLARALCRQAA